PARPLTLPLPPQSTPFPYTPLFRSLRYRTRAPAARPARHAPSPGLRPTGRVSTEAGAAGHGPDVTRAGREAAVGTPRFRLRPPRSEEHTSELQSRENLVCRLLLEKK